MHASVPLFVSLAAYPLFKLAEYIYREYNSPLRRLPGPDSPSWIYGNFKEIWENDNSVVHERWVATHGPTLKYKGLFGMTRLFTMDTKALTHILMNGNYQKPESSRYHLRQLLGEGLLVAEGDKHRQQRRIMNPAFGPYQIRELTEIFVDKAIELRDALEVELTKQEGAARVDILPWLSKTTLDVIGLAGFNYNFNSLSSVTDTNELRNAFSTLFKAGGRLPLIPFIREMFPVLRFLPAERDAETKKARLTMDRIGNDLLKRSQAAAMAEKDASGAKDSRKGRDLLSLLVRANVTTDLPDDQRMNDDDVVAQVPTFLVAGHETTSVGTTWALYALTQHPHAQEELREELISVSSDNPTMDELNALPYLDAVVRETLRIHAPVPSSFRVAKQDDVIPLETPIKDLDGNVLDHIRVNKGQVLFIPILAINRAVSIWGEDAGEFKPERWKSIPKAASSIPGVWGNLLTFLGGHHACIGYRFSIIEMKALLFTLIRAFEFQLAVPPAEIKKKTSVVQRPVLASDPEAKNQMPLLIKAYQRP
ncbi:hypothetical protein APHAL10511_007120 [Amanita phalloides]|nr:hypothetical protein APHAL10511_007120 [Amanita phalloides]